MPAFIFDLDGTLVDTMYAHVLAWQQALAEAELPVDAWRIQRRIGMRGGLLLRALGRELNFDLSPARAKQLEQRHAEHTRIEIKTDFWVLNSKHSLLHDISLSCIIWACLEPGIVGRRFFWF